MSGTCAQHGCGSYIAAAGLVQGVTPPVVMKRRDGPAAARLAWSCGTRRARGCRQSRPVEQPAAMAPLAYSPVALCTAARA